MHPHAAHPARPATATADAAAMEGTAPAAVRRTAPPPSPLKAPQARLGLEQPFVAAGNGRVRKAAKSMPIRFGPVWASVTVIDNAKAFGTCPDVVCNDCAKRFSAGATRIKTHIAHHCTCSTSELQELKQKLLQEELRLAQKNEEKKRAREIDADVFGNELQPSTVVMEPNIVQQPQIDDVLASLTAEEMDGKVADFIYGAGLPLHIVQSPQFSAMLSAARRAPPSYKLPTKNRMGGDLLQATVKRLKADERPMREACTEFGCTVVSDGWDDVERNHLINFLVATPRGAFFDGTFRLDSNDHEDAKLVAKLISDEIERHGALNVVQVCTDTCSVMQAAWKIIEKEFPWITCTCCAPHVLSLLLKDIGKLPEIASVLAKVKRVLNRFWGRKRWARNKLREVTEKNHGRKLGLYRAVETRFAGRVKEMGRMLRLKADLKYIVDTPEYAAQDFRTATTGEDDDDADSGDDDVKSILQDENGFWKPLVAALKVMVPVVKVLRMCDGNKPVIGKIYDKMFMLLNTVSGLNVPWAAKVKELVEARWEYLHSPMHAAGYALDPEFMAHTKNWDDHVNDGVIEAANRLCLREAILRSEDPKAARKELTRNSDAVVALSAECDLQITAYCEKTVDVFTEKKVLVNAKKMAPASWWKRYGGKLPLLSKIASLILGQVVCASSAERNWSVYGRIKTKGRSQLAHNTGDKLVYCHEAIHLSNKKRNASFVMDVQEWDEAASDSDSGDEAADELDRLDELDELMY